MESELQEKDLYLALYIPGTVLYLPYIIDFARSCVVDSQPVRRSDWSRSDLIREKAEDLVRQIFGFPRGMESTFDATRGELSPWLLAVFSGPHDFGLLFDEKCRKLLLPLLCSPSPDL
jgi:hypothetical protein